MNMIFVFLCSNPTQTIIASSCGPSFPRLDEHADCYSKSDALSLGYWFASWWVSSSELESKDYMPKRVQTLENVCPPDFYYASTSIIHLEVQCMPIIQAILMLELSLKICAVARHKCVVQHANKM